MRRTNNDRLLIDDHILNVLASARCVGHVVLRHEETLDRADYERLNAVLEALGGKWTRASKSVPMGGHVFPIGTDAAGLIEAAVLTRSVNNPRAGDFFRTPTPIVRRMTHDVDGLSVLEPSAGDGRIAHSAHAAGGDVWIVERDADRRTLALKNYDIKLAHPTEHDFLAIAPTRRYDRVLMNPPFSKQQDVAHVTHALSFLRPGGTLRAITATSWRYRTTAAATSFRSLMIERRAEVEELPEGTFREEGTEVNALLITIRN